MKKVLALVLAVMMMATVAFAASWVDPGKDKDPEDGNYDMKYGQKVVIDSQDVRNVLDTYPIDADKKVQKDLTTDNYKIQAIKYNEGRNLIKSIAINDDDATVEVKLIDNYTATRDKTFDVEFTLRGVGKNKPTSVDFRVYGTVKNDLDEGENVATLFIDEGTDTLRVDAGDIDEHTVYKVVGTPATKPTSDGKDYKYATLELTTADDDVEIDVRVYDGDKLYLYNKVDADKEILRKYADVDAELTFLTFPAKPEFNATATVRFYKDEGTYIYENKNGNLSPITAASAGAAGQVAGQVKWDDEEGCYILKTRTLGAYVFSDKRLNVSASAGNGTSTTNPDTGANDVVGIATALATVALVSAAAVSLKK